MCQIANGMAKGERTYSLKMQSGYDGSDRKRHGKSRKNVQPKNAEQIRWSDRKWHGKGRKDVQSEDTERYIMHQIANGTGMGERTCRLKMQSVQWSHCEWNGKGRTGVQPENAERTMGQIPNSMAKGERVYFLKLQSRYDRSGHECHGKRRKDVLAEGGEWVRRVRSRMAYQRGK